MTNFDSVAQFKVLIVDDDVLICETLLDILQDLGFSRIKMAHSRDEVTEYLSFWQPDFALLDIRMERSDDGLMIGKFMGEKNIPFIYVTAHTDTETTNRVIETQPHGYISKPIRTSELIVSIALLLKSLESKNINKLKIRNGNDLIQVPVDHILYFKSDGNYLEIFTNDKKYVRRNTIEQLLEELDSPQFQRIHRSIVVNVNYVGTISPASVTLTNDIILPVSRSYSKEIRD
jgi:two-component system response regulator LytT